MELRCQSHDLHGRTEDASGSLEVACNNRLCGKASGVVVLHTFDLATGEVIQTKRYTDPQRLFSKGKTKERSCP